MNVTEDLLRVVTNETKSSIESMSHVTPSIYASIYAKFAALHNLELEDEVEISKEIINNECETLTDMQTNTAKNASLLSEHTSNAISAIQNKDEGKLNTILAETQKLRQEIEQLKEAVYKDELTKSYNRKWLHDTHLHEDQFKHNGTLAIIDLNYFKIVNDTHGHIVGDKVLLFIANQLKLSKHDVVRYGGDEFIILFGSDTPAGKAKSILDEIREAVLGKKLKAQGNFFRTSFSIGVSPFNEGEALSEVIQRADENMYADKEAIKKRIKGIEV